MEELPNSSKLNHFRTNYRFIDFKKSTGESPLTAFNHNEPTETAESFYLSLISESKSSTDDKSESKGTKTPQKLISTKNVDLKPVQFNPKALFKAAQGKDLDYIRACVENGSYDLSILDDFHWNLLMIAVAAHNNQIIDYILNDSGNKELVDKLLKARDKSGNDALKLADRFKNVEAQRLIENFNRTRHVKAEPTENDDVEEQFVVMYCDVCKKEFSSREESYKEHVASIVHQFNETENNGTLAKSRFTSYNLRSTNKGYEMMLKLGWNETSGLGSNEQGRVNPVRAEMKLDRHGIGIVKEKWLKNVPLVNTSKAKIFKLKKSKSSSDTVQKR